MFLPLNFTCLLKSFFIFHLYYKVIIQRLNNMKTYLIPLFCFSFLFLSLACTNNQTTDADLPLQDIDSTTNTVEDAQTWIEKAIPEYFNVGLNPIESITTTRYAEYKTDMINSDYDGLTLEELQAKWGKIYDVTEDKLGLGFLIGAQDWDEVRIDRCTFVKAPTDSSFVFDLVLLDKATATKYPSRVTVVRDNDSFAIDEVKEEY